jgi:hypothetical protein
MWQHATSTSWMKAAAGLQMLRNKHAEHRGQQLAGCLL